MQAPPFRWPTELLIVALALFVLAIVAPWFSAIRRTHPSGVYLPAGSATFVWFAYELYLHLMSRPGDPLIRVDLFLLVPLAIVAWLVAALIARAARP